MPECWMRLNFMWGVNGDPLSGWALIQLCRHRHSSAGDLRWCLFLVFHGTASPLRLGRRWRSRASAESPVLSGSYVQVVIDAVGQINQEFVSCSIKCARNNFGNGMWQAAWPMYEWVCPVEKNWWMKLTYFTKMIRWWGLCTPGFAIEGW